MKIKIIRQYGARLKPIGDLTTGNWSDYAKRHGYFFEQKRVGIELEEATRKKLVAVFEDIEREDCDWFFWADADSAVSNPEIKLESFLEGISDEIEMVFDVTQYGLSSGHFFVRNTELAQELLAAAITVGDPKPEIHPRYSEINVHEETTMKILMEHFSRFGKHIALKPIADFPRTHQPSSFILHASQRTEEERIRLLTPYCK